MREKAKRENRPPHYDGRCRNVSPEEALRRIAQGERPVIRCKAPLTSYVLQDLVRGRVVFPEKMVGDFVIMRSNGLPVYNFCCVVDDYLMEITHVIRGEDHLSNTVRQLMLYDALGAKRPEFAHVSLLIGKDRQKLSKRHGGVSVEDYRQKGFLPEALVNYLCLLGWSHPDGKEIFNLNEITSLFETSRLTKAAAIYDTEKLRHINGGHLRCLSPEIFLEKSRDFIPKDHPFHGQSDEWKQKSLEFVKEQIDLFDQLPDFLNHFFSEEGVQDDPEVKEILAQETMPPLVKYLKEQIDSLLSQGKHFASSEDFKAWQDHIKKVLNIKGRPLFKGMRVALTLKGQGPELKDLVPLTPLSVLQVESG